jgi:hypothetical protein
MTPAERIISKFGSIRALARALGHENHTTVQGWKERGCIPIRHASAIMAASQVTEKAEIVTPIDFIPPASSIQQERASA